MLSPFSSAGGNPQAFPPAPQPRGPLNRAALIVGAKQVDKKIFGSAPADDDDIAASLRDVTHSAGGIVDTAKCVNDGIVAAHADLAREVGALNKLLAQLEAASKSIGALEVRKDELAQAAAELKRDLSGNKNRTFYRHDLVRMCEVFVQFDDLLKPIIEAAPLAGIQVPPMFGFYLAELRDFIRGIDLA